MRLHTSLGEDLVAELDRKVGRRQRSAFITQTLRHALEDERRWEDIGAALGAVPDVGYAWEEDPSSWVREQRRGDARRLG